jgi:3-oxoacyl-[acyl-carrier-protein] synthase-3
VLATFTSDYAMPQAAGLVQANLGSQAKFIQVDAACSGFIDALFVAHALLNTHGFTTALVIGADVLTQLNDPERFMPLSIFGDGAGAVVLRNDPQQSDRGFGSFSTGSDGALGSMVWIPGGGSKLPLSPQVLQERQHYLRFNFSEIFSWGVDRMLRGTRESIARAGISLSDVKWVVPHQASENIVVEVARRLELPLEMFIRTYADTGNTSAGSIPIALDRANRQGLFSDGDWVVLPAAGAGMAWGAATYRWYDYRKSGEGVCT